MTTTQFITVFVVCLVIGFAFFMITREIWCWYLKQNKIVSLLTEIRDELKSSKGEKDNGAN